jgi:hypothetical protein
MVHARHHSYFQGFMKKRPLAILVIMIGRPSPSRTHRIIASKAQQQHRVLSLSEAASYNIHPLRLGTCGCMFHSAAAITILPADNGEA